MTRRAPLDPYLAGVALGLVLLGSFVLSGRGLGASGAFASVAAHVAASSSATGLDDNAYVQAYLADGGFAADWLVFEVLGVLAGGALSAFAGGRWQLRVTRGASVHRGPRLLFAFAGGAVMGIGAMLARGCTSGQALSGGALLSAGSWLFMLAVFAAGYAIAPLLRRLWS